MIQLDFKSESMGESLLKNSVAKKKKKKSTRPAQAPKRFRSSKQALFERLFKEFKHKKTTEQCFLEKELEEIKDYCTFYPELKKISLKSSDKNTNSSPQEDKRPKSMRGREKSYSLF